jgi:hypothetical protein
MSSGSPLHVYLHTQADEAQLTRSHHHARGHAGTHGVTQRGSTANFVVSYTNNLGAEGPALADAVLQTCEADYQKLQGWLGNIPIQSLPFTVVIQPGSNGASHATCLATGLNCDAFTGKDPDLIRSLVVAEADEVFMANQAKGWNCGGSNGEALSRVLAAEIYPAELSPPALGGGTFATGPAWLQSDRPDFVTVTDQTDRNFVSTGCGALFINYLRHQLGYTLDQIVQAAGATLADTYQTLTGRADGWDQFSALIAAHFPPGTSAGLTDDNPFPL